MSKRSKKNRGAKQPISSQTAKRGISPLAVLVVTAAVVLALGFWWWNSKSTQELSTANPSAAASSAEFQKLTGRWQRPDGGYVLAIKNIGERGAMDAAYFNPKSIHIAKAEASRDGSDTKVFIELRDANYPGSTYTLTYDPASDQLKGIYYQAVERQRFPVAFARMK